jgi:hypothetical protein
VVPLPERIQEDRAQHAAAQPAEKVPGRGLLTVIGAIFFALGWAVGAFVSIIRYCGGAIRYGYKQGRELVPPPPPKMPSQPQPAPAGGR